MLVTAHQDFGLVVTHGWTAELKGSELVVDRPGKHRRSRRIDRTEIDRLRSVVRASQFQELPGRLGQAGS